MSRRDRDLERVHRLLRKLDLEEVLEEGLGIDVLWWNGSDGYCACPDPDHDDANPSFHVCLEDVDGENGISRIGSWNCWSHPDPDSMRGLNFLDLVAKVRLDLWGHREDGKLNWPSDEQRAEAATWLRGEFLRRDGERDTADVSLARRAKTVTAPVPSWRELLRPPSDPIEREPVFLEYLERRGISRDRAVELGVRVVRFPGRELRTVLDRTVPGVLFPIRWEGREVNWYVRGVKRRLQSHVKGRYCPGLPLGKGAGILWAPDGIRSDVPAILVEGIFDAERVRSIVLRRGLEFSVVAVLGGRLYPAQAGHLRSVPGLIHLADGDAGGLTLGQTVNEQLGKFTKVRIEQLPAGSDPGDAEEEVILSALGRTASVPRRVVRDERR